jgi:hypothetical protein
MLANHFMRRHADDMGLPINSAREILKATVPPATARGKGVGPEATPTIAGMWLLGCLSGAALMQAGHAARRLRVLPNEADETESFGDVVVGALADATSAAALVHVEVRQGPHPEAMAVYHDGRTVRFVTPADAAALADRDARGCMAEFRLLPGKTLARMARDIATATKADASVPLPPVPTEASATAALPAEVERDLGDILEEWTDAAGWDERGVLLERLAAGLSASWPEGDAERRAADITASTMLLTSLLEQLGERDITHPSQAAAYRVAAHPAWRNAAIRWFAGADADAAEAAVEKHPALMSLALRMMSKAPVR